MSLTPIEDETRRGEEGPSEGSSPGVGERVRQAISDLLGRVCGALLAAVSPPKPASNHVDDRSGETLETAIRPSGQAKLTSGPEGGNRPNPPAKPTVRSDEQGDVTAKLEDGNLRVYHREDDEAYVVSDVYVRAKR